MFRLVLRVVGRRFPLFTNLGHPICAGLFGKQSLVLFHFFRDELKSRARPAKLSARLQLKRRTNPGEKTILNLGINVDSLPVRTQSCRWVRDQKHNQ